MNSAKSNQEIIISSVLTPPDMAFKIVEKSSDISGVTCQFEQIDGNQWKVVLVKGSRENLLKIIKESAFITLISGSEDESIDVDFEL